MSNDITKAEVEQAAVSMGYRKPSPADDTWVKPMGYSMLSICWYESMVLWDQWFYGADGDKLLMWTSKEFNSANDYYGSLVAQIKSFETWEYKRMSVGRGDKFEFLTTVEALHFALDRGINNVE